MFNFHAIIGVVCMLIAMAAIFLAGLQIGYKLGHEDQQKQSNEDDQQS